CQLRFVATFDLRVKGPSIIPGPGPNHAGSPAPRQRGTPDRPFTNLQKLSGPHQDTRCRPAKQSRRREAAARVHGRARQGVAGMFASRHVLIVAIAAAIGPIPSDFAADDGALVEQIVDAFYAIYGAHPGFRVDHARAWLRKAT